MNKLKSSVFMKKGLNWILNPNQLRMIFDFSKKRQIS